VSATARQLLAYLTARQAEMTRALESLSRLESPSHDPEAQKPVFSLLAAELSRLGFAVRRLAGRTTGGQLWAVPGNRPRGRPAQLLLGHCDTVWPIGTLARMPVHRRNGRLYGPGVYDMKAGLVQGIFALQALAALGLEPPLTPAVFINSDEELGSADCLQRLHCLARHVRRVFVLEPSLGAEGRLKTRRKGSLRFTVRVYGRAAHSGLDPEKGASAVEELARVVTALYGLAAPERGVTVNVGVVEGGLRANVVAPEARAEVDVRVATTADAERLEAAVLAMEPRTPGTRLEISGGIDRPPLEATPGNRGLWNAALRCAAALGLEIEEGTAGGASDGSLTSRLVATLDGLGAVGDGAHAEHEHVVLDRMPERAALLALLLMEPDRP
jgi:glutamate carboxypeptidase